jgi:undecaprenyl-diphosphatase
MALEITELPKQKLPLTTKRRLFFAIASFILGTILFVFAYIGMHQNTGLGSFNQPVLNWMLAHRSGDLTNIAKFVTNIASPIYFAILTFLIVVVWALIKREVWRPLVLAMAVSVSAVTSLILKLVIMDSRPPIANMVPAFELDYSFPSGHTISMVVLLLVLGYLVYSRHFSYPRLFAWGAATIVIGSSIAISRLYLGYHWLTDVIASAGLGFVILAIFVIVDIVVEKKLNA